LSARHGAIVYALWKRNGTTMAQSVELLRPEVNRCLRDLGEPAMNVTELRTKLGELADIGCVTPTLLNWRLKGRVWVSV
jgi:hypothetical protein